MKREPTVKYSDLLADWLVELGYTHCFFVAGGASMHLLDGARTRFTCIPVVHEVAAGIAAEYFNEAEGAGRAFVLITAGPGLTNLVTALAGAYLESRELLVVGGQVKSTDLATDGLRQRGIQEVDGVAVAGPLCVVAERMERPVDKDTFCGWVERGTSRRPGPVFVEVCLDVQGAPVRRSELEPVPVPADDPGSAGATSLADPDPLPAEAPPLPSAGLIGPPHPHGMPISPYALPYPLPPYGPLLPPPAAETEPQISALDAALAATSVVAARQAAVDAVPSVSYLMARAHRPVWLIGGGVSRETATHVASALRATGVPLMTTWNGADRLDAGEPLNFGRPNTWGQRSANVLLQQADLVVAFGTRLGLQQTGFNWEQFAPLAKVVQCDIDPAELAKGHPRLDLAIRADAGTLLAELAERSWPSYESWVGFCTEVRSLLPLRDPANVTGPGYVCPFEFFAALSALATATDVIVPCSSGGANSTAMQALRPKAGQVLITDKGLASMGYGLAGALGAALAHPGRRTLLVEGDGGFGQNLQELATVAVNDLDLKIFLFCNDGYGSIRTTQRNYFGGAYLGCDSQTGLGFPDWEKLFGAYGLPLVAMDERGFDTPGISEALARRGPCGITVPIDPLQTYLPRIASRVTASGSMESNPLHLMSPDLDEDLAAIVFRYLRGADAVPTYVPSTALQPAG